MPAATREELHAAAAIVHARLPATPQYAWPLLAERCGCAVWVKHENHTPIGAFKVRGGLVYMDALVREQPEVTGVIAATRGNHGQSVAYAARLNGLSATIVVPHGNNPEKNAAMRALGAELVVEGHDFQAALEYATGIAGERRLHMMPSFHPRLMAGVGTYGVELFDAVPDLDAVYVPIGLGSGICGVISARDAAGSRAEVIGVVPENAAAYALSFAEGRAIATNSADTLADGMSCRVPNETALEIVLAGAARVITVSEAGMAAAMRHYFTDTHNLAEGAGAAPLAGLLKEREAMAGRKVGLILSGGNVDRQLFRHVLAEEIA